MITLSTPLPHREPCPRCKGRGSLAPKAHPLALRMPNAQPCPACDGTGIETIHTRSGAARMGE
jgi:DnaJ-class molecular chaperone